MWTLQSQSRSSAEMGSSIRSRRQDSEATRVPTIFFAEISIESMRTVDGDSLQSRYTTDGQTVHSPINHRMCTSVGPCLVRSDGPPTRSLCKARMAMLPMPRVPDLLTHETPASPSPKKPTSYPPCPTHALGVLLSIVKSSNIVLRVMLNGNGNGNGNGNEMEMEIKIENRK